ncbi:MAG: serine/threonine-protein phosphatase, partial [Chlorobiaceae bacterium]|nr:serine/threonine-protein phosphatase [Chlorobiaceae bacterium]
LERSRQRYESMQRELEAEIEKKLLQSSFPRMLDGVSISRMMVPSGHLDGDFTDYIVYGSHHADILLGDVMGHGIQAALIAAGLKSLYLKVISQMKCRNNMLPPLPEIVRGMHELCINELLDLSSFATMLFLRLDLESGKCAMVDCGHPPVLHFSASTGKCSMIKGENFPIGMAEEDDYREVPLTVEEGDLLVLYSDGISESGRNDNEMFGNQRIAELIVKHHDLSPEALIETLKTEVASFSGRDDFNDDATCIVIRIESLEKQKGRGCRVN